MNETFPQHLAHQIAMAASAHQWSIEQEVNHRLEHTFLDDAPCPIRLLAQMLVQSHELDRLIRSLRRERTRMRVTVARRGGGVPHWLDPEFPPQLVGGEYDAMITALGARHADLRRIYVPLMRCVRSGQPVSPAVRAVIGR